jgi:O-antigen ligase
VAGALSLVALVGATVIVLGPPVVAAAQVSENPVLRYSIGRGPRSAGTRGSLFASQLDIYERGDLVGIGPAATRATLGKSAASAVKEAHNDYLATLVERGPAGALALALLVGAVAVRMSAISTRPLRPDFAAEVPVPGALAGAAAAFAFSAITHEVLHYRHLWTLLGIAAALYLFGRPPPSTSSSAAPGARDEQSGPAGLRFV